jgi:methyltransferase-like protein/SAM-dependent methyltransferase
MPPTPTAPPLAAPPTNTYDEVPYESHAYAQTHPDRLAVVATLFGLRPAAVEKCRVLELGCAAGGNLIPMAEALPGATFVGIDLSARQIADGQKALEQLGLTNLTLRHASITDVDESYGRFDYIIAHGVFSWIPTAVREKLLDICGRSMAPGGVAYVSYNTYPGWHMRGMIRDMMRFHAMRFATAQLRVQQARALLDFLAQSVRQEGPYSVLLKTELESIRHQADHYLYHEHLEEVNDPLYFHQFVEMAGRHGLRYLGEARIGTMITGNFGPDVEKALKLLATDQIQTEQYMDFLRNRMFRETLLVHANNVPNWTIDPNCVARLHVASGSRPVGDPVEVKFDANAQFQTRSGMQLSTTRPLLKAAMQVLIGRWPGTVPFDELRREARALLGGTTDPAVEADDARALGLGILNTYISSDLLELHAVPMTVSRTAGERPAALPSARLRTAAGAPTVANRRHEVARLTDLDQRLVPLLDGTRDRPELVDRLTERALAGELTVQRDGERLADPAEIKAALTSVIDHALNNLAAQAILQE